MLLPSYFTLFPYTTLFRSEIGQYQSPIKSASRRFFMMLGTLVGGRICVGKGSVAASKLGLKIAMKYAYHRRQFGQDIHLQENLLIDRKSTRLNSSHVAISY